jgi:hypothetical protein
MKALDNSFPPPHHKHTHPSPVMRDMPSIQLVKTWYVKSFQELRNAPIPNTVAKEADFAV